MVCSLWVDVMVKGTRDDSWEWAVRAHHSFVSSWAIWKAHAMFLATKQCMPWALTGSSAPSYEALNPFSCSCSCWNDISLQMEQMWVRAWINLCAQSLFTGAKACMWLHPSHLQLYPAFVLGTMSLWRVQCCALILCKMKTAAGQQKIRLG